MEKRIAKIMRRSKGTIYLEPRKRFDAALIDAENIIYGFEEIIEVLMDHNSWSYFDSIDFYCYNIEPLIYEGLAVQESEDYEEI